ncbi:MAG TPA: C-type lectin domain-containing protein [Candidatus Limnocylindrales bacterium]
MRRTVTLVAAIALSASLTVPGAAAAPLTDASSLQWHRNPATGHFYAQLGSMTWPEAEAAAVALGGHLVSIADQAEEDWVASTFTDQYLWIGLTDRAVEGTFEWSSGEPVTYANWQAGEPDDWQDVGGEDFTALFRTPDGATVWIDAGGGPFPGAIVEVPHGPTVAVGAFTVEWSLQNPEAIVGLSWRGSPNLTNASPNIEYPCGGDSEYFGNSWGVTGPEGWVAPVGAGTSGSWSQRGRTAVAVHSAASDCYGTSGIPVDTRYQFFDQGPRVNTILVERRFSFGQTPFAHDFRPYIPRLTPRDSFDTVVHPDVTGTSLITEDVNPCEFGCLVADWNRSWFAVHDQYAGRGMIVRHVPSSYTAGLWVDADGFSQTSASGVVLLAPPEGFSGTVVETEILCFYDSGSWTPSLKLPPGC